MGDTFGVLLHEKLSTGRKTVTTIMNEMPDT